MAKSACGVEEALKKQAECAICLDLLEDPAVLLCGHTFCLNKCLKGLKKNLCPTCNAPIVVKEDLPKNYVAIGFVDVIKSLPESLKCAAHGNECDMLCLTCEGRPAICSYCALNDHQPLSHKTEFLVSVANGLVRNARDQVDSTALEERAKQIGESHGRKADEISKKYETMIKKLEGKRDARLKLLFGASERNARVLGEWEKTKEEWKGWIGAAEEAAKAGNSSALQKAVSELERIQEEAKSFDKLEEMNIAVEESGESSAAAKIPAVKRRFNQISRESPGAGGSSSADPGAVFPPRDWKSISLSPSPFISHPCGGCMRGITVDTKLGRVYVSDTDKDTIHAFDLGSNSHVLSFSCQTAGGSGKSTPCGIAVSPSGQIFVANRGQDCVQVFEPSGKHVRSFGSSGKGRLSYPEALCIDQSTGNVHVGHYSGIIVFTQNGKFVSDNDTYSNATGIVTHEGVSYMARSSHTRIAAHTPCDGHILARMIECGLESYGSKSVAISLCGNYIAVSGEREMVVQVVKKNGELVSSVKLAARVTGLTFGPENKLYACCKPYNSDNWQVQKL